MRTVLAAIDASPTGRAVLETALGVGQLTGSHVDCVHVDEGASDAPRSLAARADVPLEVVDGHVEPALIAAIAAPDVIVAVVGARSVSVGRRPAGHTALHILEHADKPVVVVPPEAIGRWPRPIRRLLVPLEGTDESSLPVAESLASLIVADLDIIVLHVFSAATVPRILDRPARDLGLWGDEFLARYGPSGARVECCTGIIGDEVARVVSGESVDMIALSWSQDASPGHAHVIRDVVSRSLVPVLLLPVGQPEAAGPSRTSTTASLPGKNRTS